MSTAYGARWRRIRARVLRAEPLCRACLSKGRPVEAVEVDHIVPLSEGGTNRLGTLLNVTTPLGIVQQWTGNLQPLCKKHHSAKTMSENPPGAFGSRERLLWIQARRCDTCGTAPPSEASHIRSRGAGGGKSEMISQCRPCHRELHAVGVATFQRRHHLNLRAMAKQVAREFEESRT